MGKWREWALLAAALILGAAGGVLAAWYGPVFFWLGFGAGIACVVVFLVQAGRQAPETPCTAAPEGDAPPDEPSA